MQTSLTRLCGKLRAAAYTDSTALSVVTPTVAVVTPDLTTHELPLRSRTDRKPRWEVRFEGKRIGVVEETKVGRSSTRFFHAYVFIGERSINLELDPDFEGRCETILRAWHDPSSNVHVRYALGLPDPP